MGDTGLTIEFNEKVRWGVQVGSTGVFELLKRQLYTLPDSFVKFYERDDRIKC